MRETVSRWVVSEAVSEAGGEEVTCKFAQYVVFRCAVGRSECVSA